MLLGCLSANYRDSYIVEGFIPRHIAIILAGLNQLLGEPSLRLLHAEDAGGLLFGLDCLSGQLSCLLDFL